MHDANFPYDVQWTDIDAMSSHLDFTYDNKSFHDLPRFIHDLQSNGKHYVNIIDPGISSTQPTGSYSPYDDGIERGIFVRKFNSTEPISGKVRRKEIFSRCYVCVIYFVRFGQAQQYFLTLQILMQVNGGQI